MMHPDPSKRISASDILLIAEDNLKMFSDPLHDLLVRLNAAISDCTSDHHEALGHLLVEVKTALVSNTRSV